MILSFCAQPLRIFEGGDILLATTKFGDIRFVDNKLLVPVDVAKSYSYDYTELAWTLQWANTIHQQIAAPQIDVDNNDVIILNDKLFYLCYIQNEEYQNGYYKFIRSKLCFPIINRGKLWYDRLLPSQITELNDWYEAWLDITETHCIPTEPKWLSDKLNKIEQEEIL